jgi:sugar lactone lactonase YvrE
MGDGAAPGWAAARHRRDAAAARIRRVERPHVDISSVCRRARLTAFDIAEDGTLSNRRVWADGIGPDGITMDTGGAIWCSSVGAKDCVRVLEGGEITQRIELDDFCFACMLGGPDRRTLFMLTAEWLGPDEVDEALARRTGRVLATGVDIQGVGWP